MNSRVRSALTIGNTSAETEWKVKRDLTDIVGGGLLFAVAMVFMIQAWGYGLGTVTNMRAGFFPFAVSVLAACIGIGLMAEGFLAQPGEMSVVAWRPLVAISGGIVAFASLIGGFGFLPAVAAAVGLAALGDQRSHPLGILILAACCCAGVWLIFKLGLGVNMPAIEGWL